jgi:hypothetical protein
MRASDEARVRELLLQELTLRETEAVLAAVRRTLADHEWPDTALDPSMGVPISPDPDPAQIVFFSVRAILAMDREESSAQLRQEEMRRAIRQLRLILSTPGN